MMKETEQATEKSYEKVESYDTYTDFGDYGDDDFIVFSDACLHILSQPVVLMRRLPNLINVISSYKPPNEYELLDVHCNLLGRMKERGSGLKSAFERQTFNLHRSFTIDLIDLQGNVILTFKRPLTTVRSQLNVLLPLPSRSKISLGNFEVTSDGIVIGKTFHVFNLVKKKYLLNKVSSDGVMVEFGKIKTGILRWEFPVFDESSHVSATVSRNFSGVFKEAMTDESLYVLRSDPSTYPNGKSEFGALSDKPLTPLERAVMLASIISIDFDYFSRRSRDKD